MIDTLLKLLATTCKCLEEEEKAIQMRALSPPWTLIQAPTGLEKHPPPEEALVAIHLLRMISRFKTLVFLDKNPRDFLSDNNIYRIMKVQHAYSL